MTFSCCDELGPDDGVGLAIAQALEVLESPDFSVPRCRTVSSQVRAEERFERIVESLPMSVWITRHRRILYANPAAAELLSIERRRLTGLDITELFAEEDIAALCLSFDRFERGEAVPANEYRLRPAESRPRILELSSVALTYGGDSAVLSIGRDVTARKRAEQGLLQADRLSALGLLAGGMAHALNNPLTYVALNLEQVAQHLPALAGDAGRIAEVMTRLAEAREGAERMATVVRRVRGFARSDESARRPLDLRAVLESVVELVGHELRHRGKLTTRFVDVPCVLASESKLEHICLGLLLFASQLVPDDPAFRHEVRLTLEADERRFAVFEIVCEGSTLDAADAERLFEPFVNGEEAGAQGFGLSVCRSLVEELGGHVVAEFLPGTGLLLRTTLPCVDTSRSTDSSPPRAPVASGLVKSGGKARILLIDDDPGVVQALRLTLETEHEVKCLVDPQEALKELLGDPGYDLVFCDLMMPKLSGMDLYQVLRFNRPGYESKIVFITGGAATAAARRFLSQVPNQWLEKPFDLRDLSSVMQRVVVRHHAG